MQFDLSAAMFPQMRFQRRIMTLALLILLCSNVSAIGFGRKNKVDFKTISPSKESADLTTLLKPVVEDRAKVYTKALELLSSIQALPSCQRLATSNLLDSCQSIDGSQHESEAFVDGTRSLYAAQLAVCEIQSANAIVPQGCMALSLDHKSKKGLLQQSGNSIVTKAQLGVCLQILESRPQWWTSYSNSRQNAVVICEAARSDLEKDEIINLHKTSIQTTRDADAALSEAVQHSREALRQQHEQFALVKQAIQKHLLQDVETAGVKAQSSLEKLMGNMNAGLQMAMTKMASTVQGLQNEVSSLHDNTKAANTKSVDLEKNIGRVFQKAAEGTAELASIQMQHLYESDELTKSLRLSLLQMRDVDIHGLVRFVEEMRGQMQGTGDLVVSVFARQKEVDHQIARLGQVMAVLQQNAQALHDAQLFQETTHARFHTTMEAGFNASLSRLLMIERSAAKLQGAIGDASLSIAQITSISWIMGTLWKWASLAVILLILASAVFSGRTDFVRYMAALIATLVIIKFTVALLMEEAHEGYPLLERLSLEKMVAFGFAIGMVISIAWFYSSHMRVTAAKPSSRTDSSMHHIGRTSSERDLHRTWRI